LFFISLIKKVQIYKPGSVSA